jgi:ubiquinone biosynthesis protein
MLQKSMLIIEGIGKTLDPDINMWQLAHPWMENWAIKNISIEARIMAKLKKFIRATFSNID